jgi:hypothetical protein
MSNRTIVPTDRRGQAEVTGIGKYPERPLHQYWIDTIREAAHTLPEDAEWVKVETEILVRHGSPGYLDGYRVTLTPAG